MAKDSRIRIPPHSSEAEESVLGALLLDKDAIIAVAEFLESKDFYDDKHKIIYESCLELFEERTPIDVLTVTERLKKKRSLKKVGGSSYLAGLANKVPTAAHVEHYGKIVKDAASKRALMKAASKLVDYSLDESLGADELLDKAESEIFSLTQSKLTKVFTPVKDALAESFDRLDELHKQTEGLRGVPTGFKDLDDTLAGMQKSNLIILAARPGVGKTSLALNIAQNLAVKYNRPTAFFSLEMSREELIGYVENLRKAGLPSGWHHVRVYRKSSAAALSLIFTVIALPVGLLVPIRGGVPLGVGLSILLSIVFWSAFSFCLSLGYSELIPAPTAAWAAQAIFLSLGLITLAMVRRPRLT